MIIAALGCRTLCMIPASIIPERKAIRTFDVYCSNTSRCRKWFQKVLLKSTVFDDFKRLWAVLKVFLVHKSILMIKSSYDKRTEQQLPTPWTFGLFSRWICWGLIRCAQIHRASEVVLSLFCEKNFWNSESIWVTKISSRALRSMPNYQNQLISKAFSGNTSVCPETMRNHDFSENPSYYSDRLNRFTQPHKVRQYTSTSRLLLLTKALPKK